MPPRAAQYGEVLWILAGMTTLGCGGDQGPPPTVRLSLAGQVLSAEPLPVAIPGATVALRHFAGLLGDPETLLETSTDPSGNYQLIHEFTSTCEPQDNTTNWIEASAGGYQTASTYVGPESSDPVIRCTNEAQVLNLSLQPFGVLRVITSTSGSALDPDGFKLLVDNAPGEGVTEFPVGLNDEEILSESLPREYLLELTDVASNCTVAGGNPRTVAVAPRDTAVSTFEVTCAS
jgi:hypothetical protein